MSFLKKLRANTTFRERTNRTQKRNPRQSFAKAAAAQIANLKAGHRHHRWYQFNDKNEVLVTLRNGVVALPLNGDEKMWAVTATAKDAIAYIELAVQASEAGELDEMFAATAKKAKVLS